MHTATDAQHAELFSFPTFIYFLNAMCNASLQHKKLGRDDINNNKRDMCNKTHAINTLFVLGTFNCIHI